MNEALKKQVNRISDHNVNYDAVFSIFNGWLTENESENNVMSVHDVKSFSEYKKMKEIELNYLGLFIELNEAFHLGYINIDSLEVQKDLSFNFFVRETSMHLIQDKEKLFFIPEEEIFIMLSHDFNIYIYAGKELNDAFKNVFTKNHFYALPVRSIRL